MSAKQLTTWVDVPEGSDFGIYNLPYGIYSLNGGARKAGIALGDQIIDLDYLHANGFLDPIDLP